MRPCRPVPPPVVRAAVPADQGAAREEPRARESARRGDPPRSSSPAATTSRRARCARRSTRSPPTTSSCAGRARGRSSRPTPRSATSLFRFLRIRRDGGDVAPVSRLLDVRRAKAAPTSRACSANEAGRPGAGAARVLDYAGEPVVLDEITLPAALFRGLTKARYDAYRGSMYGFFEPVRRAHAEGAGEDPRGGRRCRDRGDPRHRRSAARRCSRSTASRSPTATARSRCARPLGVTRALPLPQRAVLTSKAPATSSCCRAARRAIILPLCTKPGAFGRARRFSRISNRFRPRWLRWTVLSPKPRPVYLNLFAIRLPLPGSCRSCTARPVRSCSIGIPVTLYVVRQSLASPRTAGRRCALHARLHPLAKLVLVLLAWAYFHHFIAGAAICSWTCTWAWTSRGAAVGGGHAGARSAARPRDRGETMVMPKRIVVGAHYGHGATGSSSA